MKMASSEWNTVVDFLFENIEFHCWSAQQTCLFSTTGSFYDAMTQWHIHYKLHMLFDILCIGTTLKIFTVMKCLPNCRFIETPVAPGSCRQVHWAKSLMSSFTLWSSKSTGWWAGGALWAGLWALGFWAENYFYWPPAALAGAVDSLPTTEQSTRASDGLGLLRSDHSHKFWWLSFGLNRFMLFMNLMIKVSGQNQI